MKGSANVFMGSVIMVMIGVGIIWWFRSVIPSEAFIVSERHRESFSALNYAELARKTLEEAVMIYTQTGTAKAGAAGGLDNTVPQKDGTAIWETPPAEAAIKDTLERYIADEIAGLQRHLIAGKFLTIDYGATDVQIITDGADFSKSEKFSVKGGKEIKVSKGLQAQAITIETTMKGPIDQTVRLKYFALYDAANKFLAGGAPVNRINAAFGGVNTAGQKTNSACPPSSVPCAGKACPVFSTTFPAPAEVLQETDFPRLDAKAGGMAGAVTGAPFSLFNARFENYAQTFLAGYENKLETTGGCAFSCTYEEGLNTKMLSCTAETKTTEIAFTFTADTYAKYSSEDPDGLVPSKSLNNVPAVARPLPYETLKFNYMTHSCTVIKSGSAATELRESSAACRLDPVLTPV